MTWHCAAGSVRHLRPKPGSFQVHRHLPGLTPAHVPPPVSLNVSHTDSSVLRTYLARVGLAQSKAPLSSGALVWDAAELC